ncbi:MAG: hypothetical protein KA267_10990 [Gemmatimonadales bacterium]|nr:hypothetical protein [Gemmatimonadales bacterium]MBP6572007.1 hypothetical protein [Gemmatimonadales bacterium]MBP7620584.1 hypothetical protein [Gemmatimonadales bacterium]
MSAGRTPTLPVIRCHWLLGVIALGSGSPLAAQGGNRSGLTLGAGLYTSVRSLGTRNGGTAELSNAPAVTLGYDAWPREGAFGIRVVAMASVTEGYRAEPTARCAHDCAPTDVQGGHFLAATAGVVRSFGGEGLGLELEVGAGVRVYSFSSLTCVCEPIPPNLDPATVMVPLAFHRSHGAPLLRLGVAVRLPWRALPVRVTVAEHVSRGPTGQVAHDLLFSANMLFPAIRRP